MNITLSRFYGDQYEGTLYLVRQPDWSLSIAYRARMEHDFLIHVYCETPTPRHIATVGSLERVEEVVRADAESIWRATLQLFLEEDGAIPAKGEQ